MRAAFSNVPGCRPPPNRHVGLCERLGNTLRGGIEKKRPSKLYSASRHMCLSCGTTSFEHLTGQLAVGDAEPALLDVDEPRPHAELRNARPTGGRSSPRVRRGGPGGSPVA